MNLLDLEIQSAEAMQRILAMQHRESASVYDQTRQPLYAYGMLHHFERKKLRELDLTILQLMQTINQYEGDITAMMCDCYTVVDESANDKRRSILRMHVGNFDADNEIYMRQLLLRKLKAKYVECETEMKRLHSQAKERHFAYSTSASAIRMNLQPNAMQTLQNVQPNAMQDVQPNAQLDTHLHEETYHLESDLCQLPSCSCDVCAVAGNMSRDLLCSVDGDDEHAWQIPDLY